MILFKYHPLIDHFVESSLFSELLEHSASSLLRIGLILEVEAFPIQIKRLPSESESQPPHYNVRTMFLRIQFVVPISPATESDGHESVLEALHTIQEVLLSLLSSLVKLLVIRVSQLDASIL